MKITKIDVIPLSIPAPPRKHVIHSINPIYRFQDLKYGAPPIQSPDSYSQLAVRIETSEGICGVSSGGYACQGAYPILRNVLVPVLLGEDPLRTNWLWEKMFSVCIGQARDGVTSSAISLIDTALWDLKGRVLGQPVYNLLGGKTRDKVRVYASELYVSATYRGDPDLDLLREEAQQYVDQGFTAVKQRFGFGPWDGVVGMRKNRSVVEAVRETIGDEIEQMVDCCRSFDADYAIRMMRLVEEFDLSWYEEPVLPHDWSGYVKVREAASMPVSGGENEYSKNAFAKWLTMGCADIWQPDVDRCGGMTEVQKIVNMAEANDIKVIPHGGWVPNFHMVIANMTCPMAEYFPPHQRGDDMEVLLGKPTAVDGYIKLSDSPGFGLELNEDVLKRYRWEG
jgi:L-rhamnonate dehydratase